MTTPSARNSHDVVVPILPKQRDPRLITIRRGGTLTDEDHRLIAEWAIVCAEHVLHLFEQDQPGDGRPRDAISIGRAWIRARCVWARRGPFGDAGLHPQAYGHRPSR